MHSQALELELRALEITRKYYDEKAPEMLNIFQGLALTYQKLGDNQKAIEFNQRLLHIFTKMNKLDGAYNSLIAETFHKIGILKTDQT